MLTRGGKFGYRWVTVKHGRIMMLLICLTLACGSIGKAKAADRETLADVRCVLVAMHMVAMKEPMQRTAGMMVAMYYLGRLDEHAPHANIEQLIKAELWKTTAAQLKSDAVRCGQALQRKGRELKAIGADLVR